MAVQSLDDLGEVCQAPSESVHLIDDNDVHLLRFYILQKTLQCRSFHGATGVAAIVITGGQGLPPFLALAEDEGLACLALGIQRVKRLFEALFGRLSCVDGTVRCGFLIPTHWI